MKSQTRTWRWFWVLAVLCAAGCGGGADPSAQADPTLTGEQGPATSIARGHLSFVEGYAAGLNRGRSEGKPLLLFFTAEWCRYCHEMADEAFVHDQVVALSERFVCVLIDADREGDVCRQYHVRYFPTVQFVSSRGVPLNRVTGKQPGHQMVLEMQSALDSVARRTGAQPMNVLR